LHPALDRKLLEQRICDTIISMGPAMIKLGQSLSSRPDLVGASLANELKRLQDARDSLKKQPRGFVDTRMVAKRGLRIFAGEFFPFTPL
jgi:predicted unusual protein kinase regulating ubiquinone biosynthesis (AarF/ABC1/UbiB family)